MQSEVPSVTSRPERMHVDQPSDLSALFHRLNNQLGIILVNAELLEVKSAEDEMNRSRAEQIAASALEAMSTANDLRSRVEGSTRR